MKFQRTPLNDACIIDVEPIADQRGYFARAWCRQEFEAQGLDPRMVQANLSHNHYKGTLRGMHYQVSPYEENKLIRCTRGAIYDVIIDLRVESSTYRQWTGVELTADNHTMLFVPKGFGHGFQTLADDTEVFYQVSEFYTPGAEQGVRYDDPVFGIEWPEPVTVISEKDAAWPYYAD